MCIRDRVYDIEYRFNQFSLNTVISGFMEYNNKLIDLAKKEAALILSLIHIWFPAARFRR